MLVYAQQFTLDDRVVYMTSCERCGAVIGELDAGEVAGLATGRYGKVLCYECEDLSCPICQKELYSRDAGALRENGTCWFCWQERRKEQLNELRASGDYVD
jgi:hypothetical protein